jgi:hypothetical protein
MLRWPEAIRKLLVGRRAAWPIAVAFALLAIFAVLLVPALSPHGADGQDAPVASPFPGAVALDPTIVPLPEDCRVAPRTLAELAGLAATPMALTELEPPAPPADLGQATLADEATTEAVLAVVRESIACSNAGQLLRNYALYTDGYIRRRAIAVTGPFTQALYDAVATPRQVEPERYIALVGAGPVLILPDGRAVVEIVASDARTRRSLVVLVPNPLGWRIDELIALEDSPAPATPPATPAA